MWNSLQKKNGQFLTNKSSISFADGKKPHSWNRPMMTDFRSWINCRFFRCSVSPWWLVGLGVAGDELSEFPLISKWKINTKKNFSFWGKFWANTLFWETQQKLWLKTLLSNKISKIVKWMIKRMVKTQKNAEKTPKSAENRKKIECFENKAQ